MIRIVAAEEDFPQAQQPQVQVPPGQPPLADDDPAEQTPAGEVSLPPQPQPQPQQPPEPEPIPEPMGTEEQVPEAGELPPQEQPPFEPEKEYEQVVEQETELDRLNRMLKIPQKVAMAIEEQRPLRLIYRTLKGHVTERTIGPSPAGEPMYPYTAGTGHQILVAWCRLRNDWRGFIVSTANMLGAKLEEQGT